MGDEGRNKVKSKSANAVRNKLLKFIDEELKKGKSQSFPYNSPKKDGEEFKVEFIERFFYSIGLKRKEQKFKNEIIKKNVDKSSDNLKKFVEDLTLLYKKSSLEKEKEGLNYLISCSRAIKLKKPCTYKRASTIMKKIDYSSSSVLLDSIQEFSILKKPTF